MTEKDQRPKKAESSSSGELPKEDQSGSTDQSAQVSTERDLPANENDAELTDKASQEEQPASDDQSLEPNSVTEADQPSNEGKSETTGESMKVVKQTSDEISEDDETSATETPASNDESAEKIDEESTAADEDAEVTSHDVRRVETNVGASDREEAQVVGSELRVARESRGISIADIAQQLKLLPNIITALEDGDLETIGQSSSIYVEGYYRAYARLVDVDVSQTRFAVDRARPQILEPIARGSFNYQAMDVTPMSDRPRDKSDGIIYALVVVMVIAVGGVIWWVWPAADEMLRADAGVVVAPVESSTVEADEDEEELPYYLQDELEPPAETQSNGDAPMGVDDTSNESPTDEIVPNESSEQDFGDDAVQGTVDGNDLPSTQGSNAAEFENAEPGEEARNDATGQTGTLVLSFSGDSWVEVYGANDERLYYKMGQMGEVTSLVGLLPVRILVGDASVVTLRFNDDDVDLEPHTSGSVANLTLP